MAIKWSNWSSNGRLRAGIELLPSPSTVSSGTASQTITARCWLQTRYNSFESGGGDNWYLSGSVSASGNTPWSLGAMGTKLMGSAQRVVSTSYTGTTTTTVTARIYSRGAHPGTQASVSASWVTQRRPYVSPVAPGNVNAVRNNDNQATITWTRTVSAGRPITSHTLQSRVYYGSTWNPWYTVTNPSGTATSFVHTGRLPNRVYDYRVRANNTAGSSAYVDSAQYVWMTPAAPSNVDSEISPSGLQITTTWVKEAYNSANPPHDYTVQRSVNGGAWTQVAAGVTGSSWTDPSPGGGNNQYRVAAHISVGNLTSAFVAGPVISTVVPPLAPTQLGPNGEWRDFDRDQVFTWKHNPGTDRAAQSRFQIRYSDDGGSSWQTLVGPTSGLTGSYLLPAGTLTNAVAYLWQVSTQGASSAGFGPWSTSATVEGSTTPTVTLDPGHPADPTVQLPLDTTWAYQQDQGADQVQWEAQLLDDTWNTVLAFRIGTTETGLVWDYPVEDGQTYVVLVRARSAHWIWSDWTTFETTIDLPTPAAALVVPEYDECSGVMVLHITADDPVDPLIAVEYVTVERRVPGGEWVMLTDRLELPNDFLDLLPSTSGVNEYRVVSVSGAPSYYTNPIVEAPGLDGVRGAGLFAFLSYGDGFASVLRLAGDLKIQDNPARTSADQALLGRRKPLAMFGLNTQREIQVSGTIQYRAQCAPTTPCGLDPHPDDWVDAAQTSEIVAYRDHTGRRLFGRLHGVGVDEETIGVAGIGYAVTETDFTERYAPAPVEEEP